MRAVGKPRRFTVIAYAMRTYAMRTCALICSAGVSTQSALAQNTSSGGDAPFNAERLNFASVAALVRANHPVAVNARAAVEAARADERVARGGFDPSITGSVDQKTYKGTEYYTFGNVKLAVPTPLGVDVQFGFERAMGQYLNPERRVPSSGLFSAGLKIPLGRGIITDDRRTAIIVARATVRAAEADSSASLNKLLVQVAKDYATWYEASLLDSLVGESEALALVRLNAVRQRVVLGEAPAIDTVEASLELTRRRVLKADTERNRTNGRLQLETHLWSGNQRRITLPALSVPAGNILPTAWRTFADVAERDSSVRVFLAAHPDVVKARARESQQQANRKLVAQGLLPNVSAQLLSISSNAGSLSSIDRESSKLSADVTQSLFMIRERNRFSAAGLRFSQAVVDVARVERDVEAAIGVATADLRATRQMLGLQETALELSRLLQTGEQRRFDSGESTVFLVNTRDRSVLDEAMKLVSLRAKMFVSLISLQNARGVVDEGILLR